MISSARTDPTLKSAPKHSELVLAPQIETILTSDWVHEQRAVGKAIVVIGQSGRLHHADPQLAAWLGRDELGNNAFDLVPPELAAEGAKSMNENKDVNSFTVWFPLLHANGKPKWFRWDGRRMDGLLVDAVSPEENPADQYVHVLTS